MTTSQGFWSCAHADDEADSERVSHLAKDVVGKFQPLTGKTSSLCIDKLAVIPVMTPRFFMSPDSSEALLSKRG